MLGTQTADTKSQRSLLEAAFRLRVHVAWVQLGGIAAILLLLPFGRVVDPDFWWHLRTGKLIVTSGIPGTDPFSWTVPGTDWVTHEWLSEVIMYGTQSVFGYPGNVLLFGAAAVGALGLMYALGRSAGAGTKVQVMLALLSTVLLGFFTTPRPHVFTWLLFAAFVYIIGRNEKGDRVPVWILPALMALWVNLHLGFVYGFMIVGIWLAARLYDRLRGSDVELKTPVLALGGCFLAAMLNPEGPAIYSYVVNYAFDGSLERSVIEEWQRPYFGQVMAWPPLLLATGLIVGALLTRNVGTFLVLLSVAVIALSTQAARNIPFVALLLVPVVATAAAERWSSFRRTSDSEVQMPIVVAGSFVACMGVLTIIGAMQLQGALSGWSPSNSSYPEEGAAYVAEQLPGARLLNDYTWGGYLIENLYPEAQVFIDGRADMYGSEPVRDYLTLVGTGPGWEELLDAYGVEAVLLPPSAPLSHRLGHDPEWELVFEGEVELVFTRR